MGVVVRRYIDLLIILLIPTPRVLSPFFSSIRTSSFIFNCFFVLYNYKYEEIYIPPNTTPTNDTYTF